MASLSNTSEANAFSFGQHGSAILNSVSTSFVPPAGYVVGAIQVLVAGQISDLFQEDTTRYFGTLGNSHAKPNGLTDGAVSDSTFINITTDNKGKVGDFVYDVKTTGIDFLGKIVARGEDADGNADASYIQLDRKVTLGNSRKLSFVTRESGGGAGAYDKTFEVPAGTVLYGRWTHVALPSAGNATLIVYLAPASKDITRVEP